MPKMAEYGRILIHQKFFMVIITIELSPKGDKKLFVFFYSTEALKIYNFYAKKTFK